MRHVYRSGFVSYVDDVKALLGRLIPDGLDVAADESIQPLNAASKEKPDDELRNGRHTTVKLRASQRDLTDNLAVARLRANYGSRIRCRQSLLRRRR